MSNKQIDKAFKLFNDRKFSDASKAFATILEDSELASWMKVRIEQFKNIADGHTAEEVTLEPSLKTFSYYFNLKKYDEASSTLEQIEISPEDKTFLKAEIAIELEDVEGSIALLKEAIELNEQNIGYALNSPSFAPHLAEEPFEFLRSNDEEEEETAA